MFQFRLWHGAVGIVLLACLLAWAAAWRQGFVRQHHARLTLEAVGAYIAVETEEPSWAASIVGNEYFYRIEEVNFGERKPNWTALVSDLRGARVLSLPFRDTDDADIAALGTVAGVEYLSINSKGVTGKGLLRMVGSGTLNRLWLEDCSINNDGLREIGGMKQLVDLCLRANEAITDRGVDHLASLQSLEHLDLSLTSVRGHRLGKLRHLPLKSLNLAGTLADDFTVEELNALPHLQEPSIAGTEITAQLIAELRPNRLREVCVSDDVEIVAAARKALPGVRVIPIAK